MKTIEHIIHYEDFNHQNNPQLREVLENGAIQKLLTHLSEPTIIVLGGDGTMFSAIKKYHKNNIPFLGINFGTKGFLLNDISALEETNFETREYPLLECQLKIEDRVQKFIAMNEIDLRAAGGKMITLDIGLADKKSIHLTGDGALISTPAGSTAYNSSLGGPIIPHKIPAFVITPKAAWEPRRQSPVLIDENEIITIKNIGRKNPIDIYADTEKVLQDINSDIEAKIQKSQKGVRILIGKSQKEKWRNKVLQEQGFRDT